MNKKTGKKIEKGKKGKQEPEKERIKKERKDRITAHLVIISSLLRDTCTTCAHFSVAPPREQSPAGRDRLRRPSAA